MLAPAAQPAAAHDLGFTRTVAVLLPEGAYRIDMQVDLDALALGVSQDTDNAALMAALDAMSPGELAQTIADLQQTFLRRVRVRFDGEAMMPEVSFPDARSERARSIDTVLGLTARLTGTVPPGATELTLQASRAFPPLHITFVDTRDRAAAAGGLDEMLRIEPPTAGESTAGEQPPPAGEGPRADALQPGDEPPGDALDERLGDLVTRREFLERGGRSDPYPLDRPPPQPGRLEVVGQYLLLGFEHILPLGIDHILFVLGLFLLNTAWRPLLAQVTAFTAAHTLTLTASTYGVVSLSPAIVEPLIALSIAWIAFENVVTDELRWWRPAVVFGFGLLHGLGFAGVLAELGLPRSEYLAALLSFNVGVELGQLTVIALAFLTLGAFRGRDWYRPRVTVPASVLIGLVGLYWAFERTFTG
jgi:hydrogenase/urease accessory protein HupE